ncbi:MAG TPA: hypothetical protein VKY74_10580 [Chloroflexia bacterium]|nr:hypothetical protein [Chloroflexia bacterium]
MPLLATAERVVKCPTGHCPGWITVDDDRPQTVPCRYCRVTVNTLRYLLEGIPDSGTAASHLTPAVHAAFNSLLLAAAGMTGGNVYLRPIDRTVVSLVPSTRGVIVEYNPVIARQAGPAAVVTLLFHYLLHIDLHPRQERPLGLLLRPGARDKEPFQPAVNYLLHLADHAWIMARIAAVDAHLLPAAQAWGLDLAGMLTGNETFFPPYMAERNRRWIMEQFDAPTATPAGVAGALVTRLAALSARFFAGQREDLRRTLVAIQLADLGLRDPDRGPAYQAALIAAGLPGVDAAAHTATRLLADVVAVRDQAPAFEAIAFRQALDAALKALGLHTAFEIQTLKNA